MDFEVKIRVDQQNLGNALAALQRDPTVVFHDLEINPIMEQPRLLPRPQHVEPADELDDSRGGSSGHASALVVGRTWINKHAPNQFATGMLQEVLMARGFARSRAGAVLQSLLTSGVIVSKRRGWWSIKKQAGVPLTLRDHILNFITANGPSTMRKLEAMAVGHGFRETGVGPRVSDMVKTGDLIKIPPVKLGAHVHWGLNPSKDGVYPARSEETQPTDEPPVEQTMNEAHEQEP
jgi:hypothetical protein